MERSRLISGFTLLVVASALAAQQPARNAKVLSPEQQKYQAGFGKWQDQRKDLRAKAQQAMDAEAAREKVPPCPQADNNRAWGECLQADLDKTQENYTAFTSALHAMLALALPSMPGQKPALGMNGTQPSADELVRQFESLESESKTYRAEAVKAAYNQYKPGTIAPLFATQADQRLLRLHMQELAFVYGEELATH